MGAYSAPDHLDSIELAIISKKQMSNAGDKVVVDDYLMELRRRIMDLEACLVYVKNFLPPALKEHAEEVLCPTNTKENCAKN
jgi:hypothetical protein